MYILLLLSLIVPNVNTDASYGQIGPYNVMGVGYYQDRDKTYVGNFLGIVGTDIQVNQIGHTVGGYLSDVFLLDKNDVIPNDIDNYLLRIRSEPYVTSGVIELPAVGESFYVGMQTDVSLLWAEVIYEGGVAFRQGRSAIAYDGESLLVGYTYGDFDTNGIIDGRDFLLWQRDPSVGPLIEWQANYGYGNAAISGSPEPTSIVMLLLGIVILSCTRILRTS